MPSPVNSQNINTATNLMDIVTSREVTPEEKEKRFREITKIADVSDKLSAFHNIVGQGNPNDYDKVGFSTVDPERHAGIFAAYLMGKKGMSMQEVIDYDPTSADAYYDSQEFNEFLKQNPVDKNDPEKGASAWGEVFFNAAQKMDEYRFPDIDYSDPAQVDAHAYELHMYASLQINISQEYENVQKHAGIEAMSKIAGGADELERKTAPLYTGNDISDMFRNGYKSTSILQGMKSQNPDTLEGLSRSITQMAAKRVALSNASDMIRGKTQAEFGKIKKSQVSRLYESNVDTNLMVELMEDPDFGPVNDYFNGNPEAFTQKYNSKRSAAAEDARRFFNSGLSMKYCAENFRDKVNEYGKAAHDLNNINNNEASKLITLTSAVNSSKSLEELLSIDEDVRTLKAHIEDCFSELLSKNSMPDVHRLAGIKDPLSIIKIDGKTANELWGDKYKNFSPADKEFMLKAEIYNEMISGKRDVTCDVHIINSRNEFEKIRPVTVAKSTDTLVRETAFMKGVNRFNVNMNEFKTRLTATQADPMANFNSEGKRPENESGSESYKNMTKALNRIIEGTTIPDKYSRQGEMTVDELKSAIKQLKKAAKEYYDSHTGIHRLHAGWKANGRERINVAKSIMESSDEELAKLMDLSNKMDLREHPETDHGGVRYGFNTMWSNLKDSAKLRGHNLTDNHLVNVFEPADKLVSDSETKSGLRSKLKDASRNLGRLENLEDGLGGAFNGNPVKVANAYFKKKYEAMINKAGLSSSAHKLIDVQRDMNASDFKKRYTDKVNALSNNEQFRKVVSDNASNPNEALKIWINKEKVAENKKFEALEENNDVYKQLLWLDPKNARKKWTVGEERIEMWKAESELIPGKLQELKDDLSNTGKYKGEENPFSKLESLDNTTRNKEIIEERKEMGKGYAQNLGRILAVSYAKEVMNGPDGKDKGMELALNPKQLTTIAGYISKGLEKDVFNPEKTSYEITNELNDFDALKKKSLGYIQRGIEEEKNAGKENNINAQAEKQIEAGNEIENSFVLG